MRLSRRLDENLEVIKERLGYQVTFDLMIRELVVGGHRAALVFLENFVAETDTILIIQSLLRAGRSEIAVNSIDKLVKQVIPFMEVEMDDNLDSLIDKVLAGTMLFLIDGGSEGVILDVRSFATRSVEEPEQEKVSRGSREGFVETAVFNIVMLRRRLRDPDLRIEMQQIGRRSKTDVAVAYIDGVVDPDMLESVKERLEKIEDDALSFGGRSVEEYLVDHPYSPIPTIRYTERPDVATAHLLEGHILVIVDTSPMAMIMPTTVWHFTQHAEEFFQNPLIGTYLRWVRFFGAIIALLVSPLWLALYLQHETLPEWLQWIGPSESDFLVPLFLQFFVLEFGIDLIRMALIHTPGALSTSLGIVGAILLGELAVEVGLFVPETILVTAIVVLGYFSIPSNEFALAVRLARYFLLACAALFKLPGLIFGFLVIVLHLASHRCLGVPFLWPLFPLDTRALLSIMFRSPVPLVSRRSRQNIWPGRKGSE